MARNEFLHDVVKKVIDVASNKVEKNEDYNSLLLTLAEEGRNADQNNLDYVDNEVFGFRNENLDSTFKNLKKEITMKANNDGDVIDGGMFIDVPTKSLIFDESFEQEERFWAPMQEEKGYRIPSSSDFCTIKDYTGKASGFFDKAIFKVFKHQTQFKTRNDFESFVGGIYGDQLPQVNHLYLSDDPKYIEVVNHSIVIPIQQNLYQNALQKARFGYDIQKEQLNLLKENLKIQGDFNTKLTFYGNRKEKIKGLIDLDSISSVEYSSTAANDISYLFDDTRSISSLTNRSINDIFTSENGFNKLQIFAQKLKMITIHNMNSFVQADNYKAFTANTAMKEPVLLMPREDYNKCLVARGSIYINGLLMNAIDYLKYAIPGLKVIPVSQFDIAASTQYNPGNLDSGWVVPEVVNNNNVYMLYDKSKAIRGITSNFHRLFDPSISNAGTQTDELLIGSTTGLFTYEPIIGFKFVVPQN